MPFPAMSRAEVQRRWRIVRPILQRGGKMLDAANQLGLSPNSLCTFLHKHMEELGTECEELCAPFFNRARRKHGKMIAVYHGDEFFMMGTRAEVMQALHIKPATLKYYLSPVHERRTSKNYEQCLHAFWVDDDEDEEEEEA